MNAQVTSEGVGTVSQIVDATGTPYRASHTEKLWVDTSKTNVFSEPTQGNRIESLTTGQEYFDRLIIDCDSASSEIYIAGWQVNWDALLKPGVRLYDVLYRSASRGVNVYVMPWDDTEPVQTYDDQTKVALESINGRVANEGGKGRVYVELCPSFASTNNSYFSHHQKQVVIDRKVAFVGGIDLAYGRMDDAHFDLRADANGRQMMNRYNPGIPPLQKYKASSASIADPDLMSGVFDRLDINDSGKGARGTGSENSVHGARVEDGAWQVRYEKAGVMGTVPNSSALAGNKQEFTTLDPTRQPRMPWQDVQSRIEGPAVSHLIRNFVLRWNVVSNKKLKLPPAPALFPKHGNAHIQVLRTAPRGHCAKENKANNIRDPGFRQQDIHIAMQNLIAKARYFIYIEQQFFVSDFGEIGGPHDESLSPAAQYIKNGPGGVSNKTLYGLRLLCKGDENIIDKLPNNDVLPAILSRLRQIIVDDISRPDFHIYVTLPVHPEGALADATIAVQVYYTMQTLVFGSHSLLNGIRRLIKARELKDVKDQNYTRVYEAANTEYKTVPTDACEKYVTLLNLRNWAKLASGVVTEQIYVHSKLMIVDDRFALLGSANINDRSLLGDRDSELAVLVMDDDTEIADVNGDGCSGPVRVFAHELRKKIWSKLFGITGGLRGAENLQAAIDAPGNPESWKQIQAQAKRNAACYEAVFPHVPRNFAFGTHGGRENAKILPTWQDDALLKEGGKLTSPMPYEVHFWDQKNMEKEVKTLTQQKGFITALPVAWTTGENIRIPYPTPLVVDINEKYDDRKASPPLQFAVGPDLESPALGRGERA
jgi:phospholipase D1/2